MITLPARIEDVSDRTPLLMTPGPTEVGKQVLEALSERPMVHYGEKWKTFYASTLEQMRELFRAASDDQIALVPAPGSAVLEMAIANLASPGERILNLRNGYFGEITKECAERHGIGVVEPDTPYGKPVSPSEVRRLLEENKDVSAIVVVHNETSAGVVNPVQEIGDLSRRYGVPLIVDTVSSFGAVRVSMREWNCAVCVGYPSKGLSGIAGAVPLAVNREIWEKSVSSKKSAAGRFMSFEVWDRYIRNWGSWGHPFPTTMPTSVIQALSVAAQLALDEGIDNRTERHAQISANFRKLVRDIGLAILPEEDVASSTVTAISLADPEQDKVRAIMEREFGVMISGGLSLLEGKIIRVGHMGLTATDECITRTANALEKGLELLGSKREIVA
ncbi:MAG: alanine--glyoxylate aminotransferase family protein [Thaumarchaeota archaeon]|nr:alanine--glyoxylate aminotransferase family protein [Nitrososphaerota archaeon]